jgi:hypothetical protein
VKYCFSTRTNPNEAFEDLRRRESIPRNKDGDIPPSIGRAFRNSVPVARDEACLAEIQNWARRKDVDAVAWTDLASNFEKVKEVPYSVGAALDHLGTVKADVLSVIREYVNRAPACVQTEFRRAFEASAYNKNS